LQGEIGRKAMDELHDHIGKKAKTFCLHCQVYTGDREGYYAHMVSPSHMKGVDKAMKFARGSPTTMDVRTVIVNAHRKDLI
ncbi:hypothetical protein PENTCL1PPCAC_23294, partial [Pristionchus entomophagus]